MLPLVVPFDVPPYRLSGMVYGALLNHRSALGRRSAMPVSRPTRLRPRLPCSTSSRAIPSPSGASRRDTGRSPELEVGASLGWSSAERRAGSRRPRALEHVAGYLIVADVSIPHPTYYRPSIRFKARDGYCPLGPAVTARAAVANPDALTVRTYVDGDLVQTASTADLVRPAGRLLADVTEFMTLAPGDVLALGVAAPAPRVRSGQTVSIGIDGLGLLENPFVTAAA